MNPSPSTQYKRFKLFNQLDLCTDEDGRQISRPSNLYFKLDHINIIDMKLLKDTIFILGRVMIPPKMEEKSRFDTEEETEEEKKARQQIMSQLGKPFIFKFYGSQLLDQYELYGTDVLAFEIITIGNRSYIISFGKDLSMEYGLNTKLKIHEITKCIDPNINNEKPHELFSQIVMYQEIEKKMQIIFEQSTYKDVMLEDITMIRATEDMSAIALVGDKIVIFLMCKGTSMYKCSEDDIEAVLFYGSSGAMITNVVIRNREEYEVEGVKHKTIWFYYTSTEGVFYGTVHSNTCLIEVDKVRNVSGIQKNCMLLDKREIIVASIVSQSIIVIESGKIKNEYQFQGIITYLHKYKNYLCVCLTFDNSYFLGIFDPTINIFQYYEETGDEITYLLSNAEKFMYLVKKKEEKEKEEEEDEDYKNYVNDENDEKEKEEKEKNKESLTQVNVLTEKGEKDKFAIFYKGKHYEVAINFAISLRYTPKQIFTIRLMYADYLYIKKEYEKAIEQYVHTINFLDPNIVIQKYFTDELLDFLITYLEALRLNEEFKTKLDKDEIDHYTELLISCYIKQKKITKLEEFVKNANSEEQNQIIETAMEVCKEHQEIETAEILAHKVGIMEYIIQILLDFKNEFNEALDKIESESKVESIKLLRKFGPRLLEKASERTTQLAYNIIRDIIDNAEFKRLFDSNVQNYVVIQKIQTVAADEQHMNKFTINNEYTSSSKQNNFLSLQTPMESGKVEEKTGREMLKNQKQYKALHEALEQLKEEGEIELETEIVCSPNLFGPLNKYPKVIQYIKEYPKCLFELGGYERHTEKLVGFVNKNPFLIKLLAYFKGVGSLVMQRPEIIPILKDNWELVRIIRKYPNITDVIIGSPGIAPLVCKYPELGKMLNFYPEVAPILQKTPKIAKLIKNHTKLVKLLIEDSTFVDILKQYPETNVLNEKDQPTIEDIITKDLYTKNSRNAFKFEYAKKVKDDFDFKVIRPENMLEIFRAQELNMDIRKMISTIIYEYDQPELYIRHQYLEYLLDRYYTLTTGKDKSIDYDELTKETVRNKLLDFINDKNPLFKDMDKGNVMMLCQTYQFREGIVQLSNQGEISNELLSLYMDMAENEQNKSEHYDKIVDICMKTDTEKHKPEKNRNAEHKKRSKKDNQQDNEGDNEFNEDDNVEENYVGDDDGDNNSVYELSTPNRIYWIQTLCFLIKNSKDLFNTPKGFDNFKKVLTSMDEKHFISPCYLMSLIKQNTLSEHYRDSNEHVDIPLHTKIPYKAVKNYFIEYIQSRKKSLADDKAKSEATIAKIEEKQKEILSYKNQSRERVAPSKCPRCDKPISVKEHSYIYFLCGHSFHKECYNLNQTPEDSDTEKEIDIRTLSCFVCQKPKSEKEKEISEHNQKDSIHYKELKKDLSDPKNIDKIELLANYLKKGVFKEESWRIIEHS